MRTSVNLDENPVVQEANQTFTSLVQALVLVSLCVTAAAALTEAATYRSKIQTTADASLSALLFITL